MKKRILIKILSAVFVLLLLILLAGGFYIYGIVRESELDISLFEVKRGGSATRIYVMQEGKWVEWEEERILGEKNYEYAPLSEIPNDLINAFVAIEDKRFYTHNGVDLYRTVGAVANYFLDFDGKFGASTITQQLVKNVTGEDEVSIERKIREIFRALELERELSKDEILELYLNVINLSDNCYGVGIAAQRYFSKDVSELSLIECAAIAAITNNPSYYNPVKHPENNAERRDIILLQMREQGMISEAEFNESYGAQLELSPDESVVKTNIHSWYVDMVIEDIIEDLQNEKNMTRAGFRSRFRRRT